MRDAPASWTTKPYSVAAAHAIARELGLHPVTSSILVRRGHDTPALARAFLAAEDRHDPLLMDGLSDAVPILLAHVERGSRIVIHGDYDVDGVCSTAVLARALQRLGADPACELPSRFEDGYGLSMTGVERLAATGTDLLVTVDCGVTAVAEVARARELGIEVVVTDHHQPGEELPDCTVVHPALGGYPFAELCAAGVAHKLADALEKTGTEPNLSPERTGTEKTGTEPNFSPRTELGSFTDDLDLVALATVCDVVPLVGENRRLVREGLVAMSRTRKPGLRALMSVAGCEPGSIDAGSLGFRLGPRINAAGRLRRPDAAFELLTTGDAERAGEVAGELDLLNRERQETEERITFAAETELKRFAHQPAYVLAGEGWHPGVIGIVASRLVERYCRPVVMIALDSDGSGRGSGRSISAFDLHGGLAACSEHLGRFGGHRMAAGFDVSAESVDAFRAAFASHAASVLSPSDLRPVERVDALVPGDALSLPLCEELERLGPFGHRNPRPTLLVPAARVEHPRAMGEERQHARFTLASGGARAKAVAFRRSAGSLKACGDERQDVAVRLERNVWNGAEEARLVLRSLSPTQAGAFEVLDDRFTLWERIEMELERPLDAWMAPGGGSREVCDRRGEGVAGVLGELLVSGESVLVVCAEVERRRAGLEAILAGLAAGPAALVSWDLLAVRPELASGYRHVFALDPPRVAVAADPVAALRGTGGSAHLGWGPEEQAFARTVLEARADLRSVVAVVYRAVRDDAMDAKVISRLGGGTVAVALRILRDLDLVELDSDGRVIRARPGARTELQRSPAYRAHMGWLAEGLAVPAGSAVPAAA